MQTGKSQALGTWLKEFIYNVIIQPFHCIIYMVFMGIVMDVINPDHFEPASMGACIVAIVVMLFMKNAESIIRKIFGFDRAGTLGSAVASGALLVNSMKTAANAVGKVKGAASGGNEKKKQNKPQTKPSKDGSSPTPPNGRGDAPKQQTRANNGLNGAAGKNGSTLPQTGGGNGGSLPPAGSNNGGNKPTTPSLNGEASRQPETMTDRNGYALPASDATRENSPIKSDTPKTKKGLDMLGNFVRGQVRVGMMISGAAIGLAAGSDPVTGIMTGMNYGRAFHAGSEEIGRRAIRGVKGVGKRATRKGRTYNLQNSLIDSHAALQNQAGWTNEQMQDFGEYAMTAGDDELNSFTPEMQKYARD